MESPRNIQVCCSNSIRFDYHTVFRNELHMKVGGCLYVSNDCTMYSHICQSNTHKLRQKMCCYNDKALLCHFQWQHSKYCTVMFWTHHGQILFESSCDVHVMSSHYIVNVLLCMLSICSISQVLYDTYFNLQYMECRRHHLLFS